MPWKLELQETRRGCQTLEKTPRYDVLLNGARTGQLYFNIRGYVGYLPTPTGGKLDIGEKGITAFRREVSALNREARNLAN
ncbi:hypothetical protein [Bradyrhizobium erythrophlei]|uniref:Uncharacterized protein n=1 Tax=Bradyrhizobium erythrophlei TaxID=1437360 RepID=A0A1H4NTU1_9BRAD|nr:hypothetical protein [Bradyrhizobium erythrophlei]SEB98405.1 hypothetical protein SAMN05444164_0723 [Bradyrhizobium erythrophlei]